VIRFKKKFLFPFTASILILIIFFFQPPAVLNLKNAFVDIFSFPIRLTRGIFNEVRLVFSYHKLYKENLSFKKEIAPLRQKLSEYEEVLRENQRLNKLLSFKSNATFSTRAAQVIGRDLSNWLSTLIIDKGGRDGINIGMPVISDASLVGKIVEVSKTTSRVLLINDPNLKVAALIQNSRDQGIVSGSLGGSCRMYFLSLDSEVKINDIVVTSGLGGVFPKGLLIGRVADVDLDSTGLMKNCSIKPATNLSRLEEVLVISK